MLTGSEQQLDSPKHSEQLADSILSEHESWAVVWLLWQISKLLLIPFENISVCDMVAFVER